MRTKKILLKDLKVDDRFIFDPDRPKVRKVLHKSDMAVYAPVEGRISEASYEERKQEDVFTFSQNDGECHLVTIPSETPVTDRIMDKRDKMSARANLLIKQFYLFMEAWDENVEAMNDDDVEHIHSHVYELTETLKRYCQASTDKFEARANEKPFTFEEI